MKPPRRTLLDRSVGPPFRSTRTRSAGCDSRKAQLSRLQTIRRELLAVCRLMVRVAGRPDRVAGQRNQMPAPRSRDRMAGRRRDFSTCTRSRTIPVRRTLKDRRDGRRCRLRCCLCTLTMVLSAQARKRPWPGIVLITFACGSTFLIGYFAVVEYVRSPDEDTENWNSCLRTSSPGR